MGGQAPVLKTTYFIKFNIGLKSATNSALSQIILNRLLEVFSIFRNFNKQFPKNFLCKYKYYIIFLDINNYRKRN